MHLHDCDVISLKKNGKNIEMVFNIEGMEAEGETPFRKIVFKGGKIIERDKGIRISVHEHHHDHDHECCQHSNCVFLCCELYGKKSGYEVHMLLAMPSGLKYLTIGAADIEVINNAECCTESTEK